MSVRKLPKEKWTKDKRKWVFVVWYSDYNNIKKQYHSKNYATKKEALKEESNFISTRKRKCANDEMTFKDLYIKFIEYKKDKVKESTMYSYKYKIKYLNILNEFKLTNLDTNCLELWKMNILRFQITNQHRNNILKFFKSILNFGTKWYGISFSNIYKQIRTI